MKTPIPLNVLVTPPSEGFNWIATVSATAANRGTGTAGGSTVEEAFRDALVIALATGSDHVGALAS